MEFDFFISQDLYFNFIKVSQDTHSLHTNSDFAKKFGFEEKVVHGNLLNCFISYIVGVGLEIENIMLLSNTINYRKPLYINDKIKFIIKKSMTLKSINVEEYTFKVYKFNSLISDGKFMIKYL